MSEILSDNLASEETSSPSPGSVYGVARSASRWTRCTQLLPPLAAILVTGGSLLAPLRSAGLWAPHELLVANLSRRIAVGLHGAEHLALQGANESVPTLGELGRGQLPFSSVALGFQTIGLSDWAGRLPLALWSMLGVLALYRVVRHFVDSTAAAYAAVTLSTMPLYFVQARTMLGDAVMLASVTAATASLTMLTFGNIRGRTRAAWSVVAVFSLVAGFLSRGALFGIACPALGVGLAWLIERLSGRRAIATSSISGMLSLALGATALSLGTWALLYASKATALEVLGLQAAPPGKLPTHDSVFHQLGHGLFPWSAVAPFLLALAWSPEKTAGSPPLAEDQERHERVRGLLLCVSCVFLVSLAVHGLALPQTGPLVFVGTAAVASWIAVGFRKLDSGQYRTRLLALGSVALLLIFAKDLKDDPNQAMSAFAVGSEKIPDSFRATAETFLRYATPPSLLFLCLWLGDIAPPTQGTEGNPSWFKRLAPSLCRPHGNAWLRLKTFRASRVWWLAIAATVVLLVLASLILVDQYIANIAALDSLGKFRPIGRIGFLALPVTILGTALGYLGKDLVQGFLAWLPWPRARLGWLTLAGFGLVMSLGFYPALAHQLSPRGVFSEYSRQSAPGDSLAVLGTAREVAPFYSKAPITTPSSPAAAYRWLTTPSDNRRWLVQSAKDLAALNSLFRKKTSPSENLPIVFAQSSEVSLSVNRLLEGERSVNPLDPWLHNAPPEVQHPLNVKLKDQLRCLGWSLVTKDGRLVKKVRTGKDYVFRIHWKVLAPIHKAWRVFIHMDGGNRRHNGDHDVLAGKYPMRFWQVGDYITDEHPLRFQPHFGGAQYEVYLGLFSGKSRLAVTEGEHHEDRIKGGTLTIQ